ncbi:MAG TPA: hypothetical protein VLZ11_07665 [Flavobacterium sp.]|nr:hypothetical protein [Flavobacterium sp.]
MIIGYFDYIVFAILLLLNSIYWRKLVSIKMGCLVGGLMFGLVLPMISMHLEIQRVARTIGIIDNFEVVYTYFKYPIYWFVGMAQLLVLTIKWGYTDQETVHRLKRNRK